VKNIRVNGVFMMLKIIGRLTFLILQFLVIIAAVVLEDLSTKKMGVNRYLLFSKEKYAELFLSPERLKIYGILFIVGIIVCFILFIVNMKKGSSILLAIIYQIIGLIILTKVTLQAYPFFVLGIWIVIIFQYLWIVMAAIKDRKQR
jgi:hypothetical protein